MNLESQKEIQAQNLNIEEKETNQHLFVQYWGMRYENLSISTFKMLCILKRSNWIKNKPLVYFVLRKFLSYYSRVELERWICIISNKWIKWNEMDYFVVGDRCASSWNKPRQKEDQTLFYRVLFIGWWTRSAWLGMRDKMASQQSPQKLRVVRDRFSLVVRELGTQRRATWLAAVDHMDQSRGAFWVSLSV